MTFVHSGSSGVLLNEKAVSGDVSGYTFTHSRELGEVTSLLDTGTRWQPGIAGGSLAVRGMFNSAAGSLHGEIMTAIGTDDAALWSIYPDGTTIGKPALIAVTDVEGYDIAGNVRETVTLTIDTMPDDGVDMGVWLHALGAETADGNATSVDNGAATSAGGVGALHVSAYTGLTSAVIKIQDSADNSSFADIITFATVTAVTSERKRITGAVRRYVRATIDVTGTGSVTYAVAFARR